MPARPNVYVYDYVYRLSLCTMSLETMYCTPRVSALSGVWHNNNNKWMRHEVENAPMPFIFKDCTYMK